MHRFPGPTLVGQGEFQRYVGLKLGWTLVLAIRFVAPLADGIGSGGGQERVSTERTNQSDRAIFGNQDFKHNVTEAVGGQGICGVLGLDAIAETAFGLIGSEPDTRQWLNPGALGSFHHGAGA